MCKNIIVTCGTSQIDLEKIDNHIRPLLTKQEGIVEELREIKNFIQSLDKDDIKNEYIKKVIGEKKRDNGDATEEENNCNTIVDLLAQCWSKIGCKIGEKDNPFGGEISTLYKMKEISVFNPAQDEIVLLYSDTKAGAFSAGVLYRLLTHLGVLNMTSNNVKFERIPKLKEIPIDVSEAEEYVEEAFFDSRNEQMENIFVMTGGFKSVIPMLTICALVNNDDVYYLFEKSSELRKLILHKGFKNTKSGYRFLWSKLKLLRGTRKINTILFETGTGEPPPRLKKMPLD